MAISSKGRRYLKSSETGEEDEEESDWPKRKGNVGKSQTIKRVYGLLRFPSRLKNLNLENVPTVGGAEVRKFRPLICV
jgi:hypothetical protein